MTAVADLPDRSHGPTPGAIHHVVDRSR